MSRMYFWRIVATTCIGAACLVAIGPRAGAVDRGVPPDRLLAQALDASGEPEGRIDVIIERWSSDKEAATLSETLIKSGPDALLAVLQKVRMRAGVVLTPGHHAVGARARTRRTWGLQFAREIKTAAGRQVIVASIEHLPIGERPRVTEGPEYELTLVDVRFGPDGKGVGKLAPASKIVYNKKTKTIELANFGTEKARLIDVNSQKP